MKTTIITRYRKMHYESDYFHVGKATASKKRCRRINKKQANRKFTNDLKEI